MKKKLLVFLLILTVVLSLALPALASDIMEYVIDIQDLLTYSEWETLEDRAAEISQRRGCGVYIVALDDYELYGYGDVFDVTTQIYHDSANGFGVGSGRDGIMLLLSMEDRDWAMFVYGSKAEHAFNAYGQAQLEEVFLDDLAEDDWYGGFSDYLEACDRYLAKAENGEPVREGVMLYVLLAVGGSMFVALVVCLIQMGKMRSVHQKVQANAYVAGDLALTGSRDMYIRTTVTRRKIETDSGGSSSRSGGGGSGRTGKF